MAVLIQRSLAGGLGWARWQQRRKGEFPLGGIDSGLVFRFTLSPGRGGVFDSAKEFVIFFFEVDFEELLFLPIPEKFAKLVDQVPNFQGDPDFLLILHFSPQVWCSIKIWY